MFYKNAKVNYGMLIDTDILNQKILQTYYCPTTYIIMANNEQISYIN